MRSIETGTPNMLAGVDGAVGWMIFNKPERRNAVSLDMWRAMPLILRRLEDDPSVRVIVVRGAGDRAFVSGADISQFEAARSSVDANLEYDRLTDAATGSLASCGKPTIAMIQGYCIGGGLAIAVCCDLRLATAGSVFGIPAARLGVGYGAAGVKKLMDLVGPAFTREIFLTARHVPAAEALGMGLVNQVMPDAELEARVASWAGMIAENAPLTMRALKRTVAELLRGPAADLEQCDRMVRDCFASADFVEGRRAFMEKRRPAFRGT